MSRHILTAAVMILMLAGVTTTLDAQQAPQEKYWIEQDPGAPREDAARPAEQVYGYQNEGDRGQRRRERADGQNEQGPMAGHHEQMQPVVLRFEHIPAESFVETLGELVEGTPMAERFEQTPMVINEHANAVVAAVPPRIARHLQSVAKQLDKPNVFRLRQEKRKRQAQMHRQMTARMEQGEFVPCPRCMHMMMRRMGGMTGNEDQARKMGRKARPMQGKPAQGDKARGMKMMGRKARSMQAKPARGDKSWAMKMMHGRPGQKDKQQMSCPMAQDGKPCPMMGGPQRSDREKGDMKGNDGKARRPRRPGRARGMEREMRRPKQGRGRQMGAAPARGRRRGTGPGQGMGREQAMRCLQALGNPDLHEQLDLTEQQQETIRTTVQSVRQQRERLNRRVQAAIIDTDPARRRQIMRGARRRRRQICREGLATVLAALEPEQQESLREAMRRAAQQAPQEQRQRRDDSS